MREKRNLKTWAENVMWESEFCVLRSQKGNPNQRKPEEGNLLEVYKRFTKSFGSWRIRLGKWTKMMGVPESLKARGMRITFSNTHGQDAPQVASPVPEAPLSQQGVVTAVLGHPF